MNRRLIPTLVLMLIAALIVIDVLPTLASTQNYWTTKTPMPEYTDPDYCAATVLNGKIYAIASGMFIIYDPATDTWTENTQTEIPTHTNSLTTVTCQNKIYLFKANYENDTIDNQVYDPAFGKWKNKAPKHGEILGLKANAVDGKIYFMGGYHYVDSKFVVLSSNWAYDPVTDSWSEMAPAPVGASGASTVLDGKIYLIGGIYNYDDPFKPLYTNLVQIFDPQTNQWSQGKPMFNNLTTMAVAATTGSFAPKRIYVIGGRSDATNYPIVDFTQIYDPKTDSWSSGASMLTPRISIALVSVNDKLYALGGWGEFKTNEEYTPADFNPATSPNQTTALTPSSSQSGEPSPNSPQTASPKPSTSIPEFPTWTALPLIATPVLLAIFLAKKRTPPIQKPHVHSNRPQKGKL